MGMTVVHRWVEACRRGDNPRSICRLDSGWVVMGEAQFLRGYCLLLPDPVVGHLNLLSTEQRQQALLDATRLGDALLALTDAVRINYEILGNLEPALHIHVCPRYDHEAEELRSKPIFFYDWQSAPSFDAQRDGALMAGIRDYLLHQR
ncbi:MAG: hypothetical protein RLZZ385_1502 [Pseudomonadota bacterium]|jgi:diadenosine tetraphosphate (Ap4A) HIT family hydrolase